MNLESFIQNNEIYIDKNNWKILNQRYSKDEIKDELSELILKGKIDLPFSKISIGDAKKDFYNLMNKKNVSVGFGEMFSRYEYSYEFSDIFIQSSNVGNSASNFFQQENRFEAGHANYKSPVNVWKSKNTLLSILNSLWSMKHEEVNTTALRSCIQMRSYINSQFKPNIAKFIYNTFKSKDVLDFSSGWGDRLCGFYSSNAKSYFGIDPNTKVYETYFKQIELYEQFVHKDVHIENLPAEDVDFKDRMFDTIFTSPPYFKTEKYCDEETQSWKRYPKLDSWLNDFLFKVLKNAWDHLKEDGYLILNISDVYISSVNKICDPMNDFISTLENAKYLGCVGMVMTKRPNSLAKRKEGTFIEPMWVWQKSTRPKKIQDFFEKKSLEDW